MHKSWAMASYNFIYYLSKSRYVNNSHRRHGPRPRRPVGNRFVQWSY